MFLDTLYADAISARICRKARDLDAFPGFLLCAAVIAGRGRR